MVDRDGCLHFGVIAQANGHNFKGKRLALAIDQIFAHSNFTRIGEFKSYSFTHTALDLLQTECRTRSFVAAPILRRRLVKGSAVAVQHRNGASQTTERLLPTVAHQRAVPKYPHI